MKGGRSFAGRSGGRTIIGIGLSRTEVRMVAVKRGDLVVWNHAEFRGREQPLTDLIARGLARRPASLGGSVQVACVVGPTEAQLRPLHGLPHLRFLTDQSALVAENLDRFFVSDGARMRLSTPIRSPEGEIWAAAVTQDVVTEVADACRRERMQFIGIAPVAAALGHLIAEPNVEESASSAEDGTLLTRMDDGARLHIEFRGRTPVRIWRERTPPTANRSIEGAIRVPESLDPYYIDAFAATQLRARDPFVVGEHSDDHRRARHARQRTWLWVAATAASLAAAVWAPGALATRRVARMQARLSALAPQERELREAQAMLARATTAISSTADFERSRRSITVLLGELALALPDSTAVITMRVDSVGGSLTVLAPRAAGALEAMSALPVMARVQVAGPVTREITAGVELERAAVRFTFARRMAQTRPPSRTIDARAPAIAAGASPSAPIVAQRTESVGALHTSGAAGAQ